MRCRNTALLLLAPLALSCDGVTDPVLEEGGFAQLAVGMWHTCALTVAGNAYCWGRGVQGQLGTGADEAASLPRRVPATVKFASITAGGAHTCAIATDQVVYCWGANEHGQAGAARQSPAPISTTLRFVQVAAGMSHTCARTATGAVYCWGANGQGQSGGTAGSDVATPRAIVAARPFVTISAGGFHSCGIDDRARGWCWGANHLGQLGDGTSRDSSTPREIADGHQLARISAGYTHTCAADAALDALCWGSADRGEIGTGAVSVPGLPGATTPRIVHLGDDTNAIAAGFYSSCAARSSGIAHCWGRGTEGQLGNGLPQDAWSPILVSDGDLSGLRPRFTALGIGAMHACGLTAQHAIYCWGKGSDGQLGAAGLLYSAIAVRVAAPQ